MNDDRRGNGAAGSEWGYRMEWESVEVGDDDVDI